MINYDHIESLMKSITIIQIIETFTLLNSESRSLSCSRCFSTVPWKISEGCWISKDFRFKRRKPGACAPDVDQFSNFRFKRRKPGACGPGRSRCTTHLRKLPSHVLLPQSVMMTTFDFPPGDNLQFCFLLFAVFFSLKVSPVNA